MDAWYAEKERLAKEKARRLDVTALPTSFILRGCKPILVRQVHVQEALRVELGDLEQMITLLEYAVDQGTYFESFFSKSTGDTGTSSITLVRAWYYFSIPLAR